MPGAAEPDVDFTPVEGVLVFMHQEGKKEITIPILQHADAPDGEERDEILGIKLFDPEPTAVKISKKDTLLIEIVTDAEKVKQSEAL